MDASGGHAALVWVDQPSIDKRVWAVVRDTPPGSWSTVAPINPSLTSGTSAAVGVASDGTAIVAYLHQASGLDFSVRASRCPPASIFPSSADVVSAGDIDSGGIALEVGDSEATTAFSVPDIARRIDAATAPLGSAFGAPVTLSDGFPVTGRPSLSTDGAGGTVVTWGQADVGGARIVARRRPPGGAWTPIVKTAPSPPAAAGPFAAALPAGDAAVAWVAPPEGRTRRTFPCLTANLRCRFRSWSPQRPAWVTPLRSRRVSPISGRSHRSRHGGTSETARWPMARR